MALFTIFVVTALAFGGSIFEVGLYWDDWALYRLLYFEGPDVLAHAVVERPVLSQFLGVIGRLVGDSILGWQLVALGLRMATALAAFAFVRALLPGLVRDALLLAALLMVFPGFSQQFIPITYAGFWLCQFLAVCSMALMIVHFHRGTRALHGLALVLTASHLAVSAYCFGFELMRPLILGWLVWREVPGPMSRERLRPLLVSTVRRYLPYAVVVLGFLVYRVFFLQVARERYSATGHLTQMGPAVLAQRVARLAFEAFEVATSFFGAQWNDYASFSVVLVTTLLVAGTGTTLLAWGVAKWGTEPGTFASQPPFAILSAGSALWVLAGLVPFTLLASKTYALGTTMDRFSFGSMLATVLLMFGIAGLVTRGHRQRHVMLLVLLMLTISHQIRVGQAYEADWRQQMSFARAMKLRVPDLAPGTAIFLDVTREDMFLHHRDFALANMLEIQYFGRQTEHPPDSSKARCWVFWARSAALRFQSLHDRHERLLPEVQFTESSDKALAVAFTPDGSLRVHRRAGPPVPQLSFASNALDRFGAADAIRSRNAATADVFDINLGSLSPWEQSYLVADREAQEGRWAEVHQLLQNAVAEGHRPVLTTDWFLVVEAALRQGDAASAASGAKALWADVHEFVYDYHELHSPHIEASRLAAQEHWSVFVIRLEQAGLVLPEDVRRAPSH